MTLKLRICVRFASTFNVVRVAVLTYDLVICKDSNDCLGIQIDNKLDWNKHISTVADKGQSKLAFLNRNLKGCPKKLRDTAYISLIRPALEYSCSVWHPHKKSNKDKIEKVQRRAARSVSNNFRRKASVSEMLHNLGWQSLDSRRQDQRLVLFYKIINGLASVETEDILTPADSRTTTRRITASNSNTSRQIVIHIGTLFFQPLFQAGTTFHLALRRLTV